MLNRVLILALALGIPMLAGCGSSDGPKAEATAGTPALQNLGATQPSELATLATPYRSYGVYLINMSNLTVKQVRVDGGRWMPAGAIGQTCARTDQGWCLGNKKYQSLAAGMCGMNHTVEVKMTDGRGGWYGMKQPWKFFADCRSEGGVFALRK